MNAKNYLVGPNGSTNRSYNRFTQFRNGVNHNRKKLRPQRTSTPVDCSVERSDTNTSESYSDSVSEFFYQSWKNELKLDDCEEVKQPTTGSTVIQNFNYYIVNNFHPVWYPNQMLIVNTMCPYVPSYVTYCPAVGYRTDGTYGILPGMYYCCYR